MRNAFAKAITEFAKNDRRICLLTGDIGNRLFDDFKESCPDRFYNCGIAESNMTSFAAGLAIEGFIPITYTIASFNTYRCYEQIKLDVCFQNLPVIIVGTGAGLSYASLNATHHALEDIACMRVLPNMTVLCPGDPLETVELLRQAVKYGGPVYLRLGKKGEENVQEDSVKIKIGKAMRLSEGEDIAFLSTGCFSANIQKLKKMLENKCSISHYHFHTVKPLDTACLLSVFSTYKQVFLFEEHSEIGGFGGAVAEWYMDHVMTEELKAKIQYFKRFSIKDKFMLQSTHRDYALQLNDLSLEIMANKILACQMKKFAYDS